VLAAFILWPAAALEDGIADRTHRLFYLFLSAVGVETSDMHGLLYRIFAALKFDGAKFGESPTRQKVSSSTQKQKNK